MLIRDRLDVLFEDEEFAGLCPDSGRPGLSPGQLTLEDAGFDHSGLREFRARPAEQAGAADRLLQLVLDRLRGLLLRAGARQRTDVYSVFQQMLGSEGHRRTEDMTDQSRLNYCTT